MIRFSANTAPKVTRTAQPLESTIPQPISTDVTADPQNTSQKYSNNPNTVSTKNIDSTKVSNIEIERIFKNNNLLVTQEIDKILKPLSQKTISKNLRKKKRRLENKSNNNYLSIVPKVNTNINNIFNPFDSNNQIFINNNNIIPHQTLPKEVINSDILLSDTSDKPIDSQAVQHNSSKQRVMTNKKKILSQTYNPKKKSRLILDSCVIISPNSTQLVPVFIKNFNPGQLYVTNQNPDLVLNHNIAIMHAVVNKQCTGLALTNIGSKPEYLIQGLTICVITAIVDGTNSVNDCMNECVNEVNSARTTNTTNINTNTNITNESIL